MSVSYTDVTASKLLNKATSYGVKKFVYVKVDFGNCEQNNPFPDDYDFPVCFMPKKYATIGERILNLPVRPDDIWISTFPKAGTTWTMNIVSQLMNGIDFSTAFLTKAHRTLEESSLMELNADNIDDKVFRNLMEDTDGLLDERNAWPSPRLMKVHLPAHLMPKQIWTVKPKLIYVHRNAKDVACSMYHMLRNALHLKYTGTIEDCFDVFLNDHIVWGPFHEHVDSFQQISKLDNILLLNYEDMLSNTFAAVKKISEFLNYRYTDDQLKQLADHVSFENMRGHYRGTEIMPSSFK